MPYETFTSGCEIRQISGARTGSVRESPTSGAIRRTGDTSAALKRTTSPDRQDLHDNAVVARRPGQIIARGENTWLVRIFLGRDPETGKRNYHNHTVRGTRKDAQRYLTAKLRDRDVGVFAEPSYEPLNRYLDRWLDAAAKPKLKSKTFRDYENLLVRYVRPELGHRPLAQITPLDIQALYGQLQIRELSDRTVRYARGVAICARAGCKVAPAVGQSCRCG